MRLNTVEQIEWLRKHFEYLGDDMSLPFVRKIASGYRGCRKIGERVGCRCESEKADGYARLRIGSRPGVLLLMSRAVWMFHNGEIPEGYTIDHISVDHSDNRIENLRLATPSMQCQNRIDPMSHNIHSGVLGVGFRNDCPKKPWFARVGFKIDGKQSYKKSRQFATIEEAIIARDELARIYHEGYVIR